jgi:membrane fusion protein (multidrug efflux system)
MARGRIVIILVLLSLVGAAVWLLYGGEDKSANGRFGRFGRGAVTVGVKEIEYRTFSDIVEALGTANARESIMLSSPVSEIVHEVHFEDGQIVKRGDILVTLVSAEENAQLREAEANVLEARQQYERTKELVERGNASGATLDTQQRRVEEVQSRLEALQARMADRLIRAPFDGVLGLRQISAGSLISPTTEITTLDDIDSINLDFAVPERFVATLGVGQAVSARVEAYPDRMFEGTVKSIDSRIDPATRSVIVRAEVPNKDHAIKPGMLMEVEVVSRKWEGLSLPEEAVIPTGGQNFVFIVEDGTSVRKQVELGLRRPGYVEVLSGVNAGDRVVTEGTLRLGRQGLKVRILGEANDPKPQERPNRKGN